MVLPFRRNWLLILIVGVILMVFSAPLLTLSLQSGPGSNDLFALVFSLFRFFWGLGWSVGVVSIALVFLALILGREVVEIQPGSVLIRLEILGLGVGGVYQAGGINNLRRIQSDTTSGNSWRGEHLAFDYFGIPVAFGSDLDGPRAGEILGLFRGLAAPSGVVGPGLDDRSALGATARLPESEADGIAAGPEAIPSAFVQQPPARPGWQERLASPSSRSLILANLVPLAGVYFLHWDIGEIMLLYWAESGIVGVFNLLKMAVVGRWSILFYGPFFAGHYGAFMAVHLLFVYGFFVKGPAAMGDITLPEVVAKFITLWPGLLALGISHLISFWSNFIGGREYLGATMQKQLTQPYGRIIAMHLTIIFGGFVVMSLGTSLPALLLLISAKIGVDLSAHTRQRTNLAAI